MTEYGVFPEELLARDLNAGRLSSGSGRSSRGKRSGRQKGFDMSYDIRIEENNFGAKSRCCICGEQFKPDIPFSLQIRDGGDVCPECGKKHSRELQWLLDFFYSIDGDEKFFSEEEGPYKADETSKAVDDIPF